VFMPVFSQAAERLFSLQDSGAHANAVVSEPSSPTSEIVAKDFPANGGQVEERESVSDALPATEPMNATPHNSALRAEGALFDLPALEKGVERFLDKLEQAGTGVAGEATSHDLFPWLAAATVSALACEIARRQLSRTSRKPDHLLTTASGTWLPD
jgi:hypothetical protein